MTPTSAPADLALTAGQVGGIGIGVVVALAVLAVVVAVVVSRIVVKLVTLLVIVVLAVVVWSQRAKVEHAAQDAARHCSVSFFGFHVRPDDPATRAACARLSSR